MDNLFSIKLPKTYSEETIISSIKGAGKFICIRLKLGTISLPLLPYKHQLKGLTW